MKDEAKDTALRNALWAKVHLYEKKSQRAKRPDRQEYWWNRYRMLSRYLWKPNLRPHIWTFGEFGYWASQLRDKPERWKQREAERIEKGKIKFETTRYFAPWFMSRSLGADYGSFVCDNCNRTFYHSPSRITKASKEIIHCCCGYCTNEIIQADHGNEPFD